MSLSEINKQLDRLLKNIHKLRIKANAARNLGFDNLVDSLNTNISNLYSIHENITYLVNIIEKDKIQKFKIQPTLDSIHDMHSKLSKRSK